MHILSAISIKLGVLGAVIVVSAALLLSYFPPDAPVLEKSAANRTILVHEDPNPVSIMVNGEEKVEISFVLQHYPLPEGHVFRYRLAPVDNDWKPWRGPAEIRFEGLDPGSYVLHLQLIQVSGASVVQEWNYHVSVSEMVSGFSIWWIIAAHGVVFVMLVWGFLRLAGRYTKNPESSVPEPLHYRPTEQPYAAAEKVFLDRVVETIGKNMSDETFDVDALSDKLNQSRSNLHRKLVALTGEAPSDMIRRIRLETAAKMLKDHKGNVSEVAYHCGFKSIPHFSRAFKRQYRISPKEYMRAEIHST